ncbi:hypothetical protein RHMOL_Rhmol12G0108000 [Rhododendron molle]|uniref:Uncharacterized protein n=1 Tax=Rhododendron molle TaxID=49168 RepID=A0ACC0LGJ4_RHOML|nr:hypothetical protein RHMOL_Rhmol12G0108000 [Rhododendron molle]
MEVESGVVVGGVGGGSCRTLPLFSEYFQLQWGGNEKGKGEGFNAGTGQVRRSRRVATLWLYHNSEGTLRRRGLPVPQAIKVTLTTTHHSLSTRTTTITNKTLHVLHSSEAGSIWVCGYGDEIGKVDDA